MRNITLFDCLIAVSAYYEIKPTKIKSPCCQRRYTLPRQMVMHLARRLTGMSYCQIASRLGKKDHTTIIHGDKTIAALMETNDEIRKAVLTICEVLYDDLYRTKMNFAWEISCFCRNLRLKPADEREKVKPQIFWKYNGEPLSWQRPRASDSRAVPYIPSSFKISKERLMGARA